MTSVPGSIPRMICGLSCNELNLNKNTKIWLNSLIGIAISVILLYSIWLQVQHQLIQLNTANWWQGSTTFLWWALALMPLNLSIEVIKWKYLVSSAQPITRIEAWKSYLAGIAFSFLTPNRVGEYPARIIYLKNKNTIRLISVAILGAFAQFITLFIYGCSGLVYYNFSFPGYWQRLVLALVAFILIILVMLYFNFERWIVYFERLKWFKRLPAYGYLLRRFTKKDHVIVLLLSMARFAVFTTQYILLLNWMNIALPFSVSFFMATLYFWSISVIPSIAFAELGVRGQVSLFLFQAYTQNAIGILVATMSLWAINLIIPAVLGSILLLRLKLLR